MMDYQHLQKQILCLALGLIAMTGCGPSSTVPTETPSPIPGVDEPIFVEDVSVMVHEARVRSSYQTHYLMTYPSTSYKFYEVIVSIEGTENPLAWGESNLRLVAEGREQELALARKMVVGEDVEFEVGEDFDFRYIYIFNVPQESDFTGYRLELPNGQNVDLASILEFTKQATPQPSDLQIQSMGTVGGGEDNEANGQFATVCGGSENSASAYHTTVCGGSQNEASASHAFVGGGRENSASYFYATVGGGYGNIASGRDTTVGGGSRNTASDHHATVAGGIQNNASSTQTTIGGGGYNTASDVYATVCGGTRNLATGYDATIGGGAGNSASADHTSIGGGLGNLASGSYATVGGGHGNDAQGSYAMIPGGLLNEAAADYSFAAGQRAIVGADHRGTFLFADSTDSDFVSAVSNEFGVRATGGVRFVTSIDLNGDPVAGVELSSGSGSWSSLSDRDVKANVAYVDTYEILRRLSELPISTWNYTSQDSSIRHIGPMAQDFNIAFGVGEDEKHISMIDADGVALAAIQGLYRLVEQKETQIAVHQQEIAALEARITALEQAATGHGMAGIFVFDARDLISAFSVVCLVAFLIQRKAVIRLEAPTI